MIKTKRSNFCFPLPVRPSILDSSNRERQCVCLYPYAVRSEGCTHFVFVAKSGGCWEGKGGWGTGSVERGQTDRKKKVAQWFRWLYMVAVGSLTSVMFKPQIKSERHRASLCTCETQTSVLACRELFSV